MTFRLIIPILDPKAGWHFNARTELQCPLLPRVFSHLLKRSTVRVSHALLRVAEARKLVNVEIGSNVLLSILCPVPSRRVSSQDKGIQVLLLLLPFPTEQSQDEPVLEKFIRGHPFLGRKHPKDPCFFGNWNGAMDRDAGI